MRNPDTISQRTEFTAEFAIMRLIGWGIVAATAAGPLGRALGFMFGMLGVL